MRAGLETDDVTGAVVPPIHLSATYAFRGYGEKRAYDYSRSGNPTRDLLGRSARRARGRRRRRHHGLGHGRRHAVPADPAGAAARSWRRTTATAAPIGCSMRCIAAATCEVDFVNFGDAAALRAALSQAGGACCGSRRRAIRCCASPTSPPSLDCWPRRPARWWWSTTPSCRPPGSSRSSFGADLVVHSTTKYINGHSDVVGGAVIAADQRAASTSCAGGRTASG